MLYVFRWFQVGLSWLNSSGDQADSALRRLTVDVRCSRSNEPGTSTIQVQLTLTAVRLNVYWQHRVFVCVISAVEMTGLCNCVQRSVVCCVYCCSTLTQNIRERRGEKVAINIPSM